MSYTQRVTTEAQEDLRSELICELTHAIDRSISHNEIVPVKNFHATREGLLTLLSDLRDEDVEWVESDGVVDVWGCHGVHEDIMLWRLLVDCCSERNFSE